jgi:O-methyltransferase/aklanonic acid methyltransferase
LRAKFHGKGRVDATSLLLKRGSLPSLCKESNRARERPRDFSGIQHEACTRTLRRTAAPTATDCADTLRPAASSAYPATRVHDRRSYEAHTLIEVDSPSDSVVGLFSRAAPTYDTVGPRHFSYFADRLVEFVGIDAGNVVLDVATGAGAVLFAATERVGTQGTVVGIDLSPAMLARAAAEVERRSIGNVELGAMDGERLRFATASFDTALCSFGLQAFVTPDLALAGFRRVLRAGGRLGIAFPLGWPFDCDSSWRWQADVLRAFGCKLEADDALHPAAVPAALSEAGFVDVETRAVTCPLQFADAEEWWSWSWSHGTRSLFEQVAQERLPALREALFEGLESCRGAGGVIHGALSALLTRATTPT